MLQGARGAAAEIIKMETRDFFFFFSPPSIWLHFHQRRHDAFTSITSCSRAEKRCKNVKSASFFGFFSAHMYAPAMTPSWEGLS